jgi:hypothetical protein
METLKTGIPPQKRGPEGIPEGLAPEEVERLQKLQAKLTDFILHLIQSFLRTGYYTPEHPESKKAKDGLYQAFKDLFAGEDEISFLAREDETGQEVLVEGVLPEAQRLSRMMMKGMGELYIPKVVKYLERKDLSSLTLKSRMGQTEFTRFIDVMSDPSQVDMHRKEDKERFLQTLYTNGIHNISFVFNEELLESTREMPWRARVMLSRIRKDLRMIPYFQKMSGEQIQDVRRKLIQDGLRPLRQPDLIWAVLKNSDLATTRETPEEIIENEIVSSIQKQHLPGTSRIFVREHLAVKQLNKQDPFEAKSDRLLKKIISRLKEVETPEADGLLEEFFRQQLVGLDDLSPAIRDKILLERLTDKFLNFTEQFFQQLDQAKEKERFLVVAGSFVKMIPELIHRDRFSEILRIIETLRKHFHQRKMWALLAGHILEEIGQGSIPLLLKEKFLKGKKELRIAIVPIFISLEIGGIPPLLDILKTSEDQWVRKNACEALIEIGPVATIHLLKVLEEGNASLETTCDILRVLGEIDAPELKAPLVKSLRKYATHENPKLREQGIHTFCRVAGAEGEGIFLSALDEPDPEVRKRAVWCLGTIKSVKGAEKMMEILTRIWAAPSPETEPLETQIYLAFGVSGNLTIEGRTIEEVLLDVLEKRGMKKWGGLFQKNPLTDDAVASICTALGKMGTERSLRMLNKLGQSREAPWISKAREASRKIEERSK